MNCRSVAQILDLYQEGRLSPARTREVAAHLAACPSCAASAAPRKPSPGGVAAGAALKERLGRALSSPPAEEARRSCPTPSALARRVLPAAAAAGLWLLLAWALGVVWGSAPAPGGGSAELFAVRRLP